MRSGVEASGTRPGARPGGAAGELPLILPPERPEDRAPFWSRYRGLAVALLAVAALGLGAWFLLPRLTEGEGGVPVEAASPAAERFTTLEEEFGRAVEAYHRTRTESAPAAAGCSALAEAYRAVDEAFLALSGHFARVRDRLGKVRVARYEAAAREMEEVDRSFDASGCPRPG